MRPHAPAAMTAMVLCFGLAGCGGPKNAATGGPANATAAPADAIAAPRASEQRAVAAANIADGPDVCFRAVGKQIGADAKVSEINAFFSSGSEIDSSNDEPKGALRVCTAQYQNPSDPRKLLNISMDMATGKFSAPGPVEISVSSSDAASFKLEDYVIPLSRVNAAGLAGVMEAQNPKLASVYGKYAWTGVRLEPPDAFSRVPTLRLDVDGRLASNDVKAGGYASIATDGKTMVRNLLMP